MGERSGVSEIVSGLIDSFRYHVPFILYVLVFMCALVVAAAFLGGYQLIDFSMYGTLPLSIVMFLVPFFLGRYIHLAVFVRPEGLMKTICRDFTVLVKKRFFQAIPILIFLPLFMSAFTGFKHMIPMMNPYSWDPAFDMVDTVIHGGVQPWVLLQSILSDPLATFLINFNYNAWFFVMFIVLFWQAFSLRNPKLRMQFFLAFVMTWSILGLGLATLLSSAGPCYYERIYGVDVYHGLMHFLTTSNLTFPVWALDTQDLLWDVYASKGLVLGSGISAMPSMHVAATVLFALVGWRYHWLPGLVLTVFSTLIMVGSVHLAWHYAIDGYVSIILTLFIWRVAGMWVDRLTLPDGEILPDAPLS